MKRHEYSTCARTYGAGITSEGHPVQSKYIYLVGDVVVVTAPVSLPLPLSPLIYFAAVGQFFIFMP